MTVDSLGRGAGDALRIERDPPRVNIESILPRLPRNLDDMSLNLPRLQPLHRFLDRTKPTDERGLVRHRRSRLGHLLSTITIHVRGSKNERPLLRVAYIGVEEGGRKTSHLPRLRRSDRHTKRPGILHSRISPDADARLASYKW